MQFDERTQRLLDEYERNYLKTPEECKVYCDWCGEEIEGKYYHIHGQNYCLECMEYFEKDTDD